MRNFSTYAIIVGIIGILLFILAGVVSIQEGSEPLSTIRGTVSNGLLGVMLLCYIVSIVLGILGFKKKEVSIVLRCIGLLFIPIVIISIVSFLLLIAIALA